MNLQDALLVTVSCCDAMLNLDNKRCVDLTRRQVAISELPAAREISVAIGPTVLTGDGTSLHEICIRQCLAM